MDYESRSGDAWLVDFCRILTLPKAKPKPDAFTDLLTRLARVPKREIDVQVKKYQKREKRRAG